MMDENKRSKLRSMGYSIRKCCGLCEHAKFNFLQVGNVWGDCMKFTYDHKKHTGRKYLSINQFGYCQHFKWNQFLVDSGLDKWKEYIENG
jgi:hypothetical protein